jgi:hypothetical protein
MAHDEHPGASRLAVEASVVRDAAAAERRDHLARLRARLEKEEHDARHEFVADRLGQLDALVGEVRDRLAELQRARDAKLLQQALRLSANFVGIGLAERGDYLQVESLVEGGPGMAAGLRLGDLVLTIGGIPVSTTLEMRSAMKRAGFVSKRIEMVIRRFAPADAAAGVPFVRLAEPSVLATVRPAGRFADETERVHVLVSTVDERFRQFPFFFDARGATRVSLPLVAAAAGSAAAAHAA